MCVCVCVCVCVSLSLSLSPSEHVSAFASETIRHRARNNVGETKERVCYCYADVTSDTNPIAKLRGREIIGHPTQLLDLDRGQRCHRIVDKVHTLMPNSGKKNYQTE